MVNPDAVPLTIDDKEELGRRIYSSRERQKILSPSKDGKLPVNLFMPPKNGPQFISTDRLSLASTHNDLPDLTRLAKRQCPSHKKDFYGWARLSIPAVTQEERTVKADRPEENPYHAHIVLPETAVKNEAEIAKHAQQLADEAALRGVCDPVDRE